MRKFTALENGTLSDPYRFVQKGSEVELTNSEAKVYAKSKWLIPSEVVAKRVTPPLMSHMNIGRQDHTLTPIEALNLAPSLTKVDKQYQENMDRIVANEKAQDGFGKPADESTTGEGTGNQDVLGG